MIQELDFRILDWIQANLRTPWMDWLMPRISALGNAGMIWIVLAVIFLLRRPTRRWGMTMAVGLLGSLLVCNLVLKNAVARPRPCWINQEIALLIAVPKDYSFPSGHTTAGFITSVVLLRCHRRVGLCALFLAALVAFSRLYLYVHFPTDVLGGALIGAAVGFAAVELCRMVLFREKTIQAE